MEIRLPVDHSEHDLKLRLLEILKIAAEELISYRVCRKSIDARKRFGVSFIYIVDDWNLQKVRDGTWDGIKEMNLKILYNKAIRLTYDNSITREPLKKNTWWNGIYMAVLQK